MRVLEKNPNGNKGKQGKTNDKGRHTVESFKFMGAKFRGLLGFTYSWDVIS